MKPYFKKGALFLLVLAFCFNIVSCTKKENGSSEDSVNSETTETSDTTVTSETFENSTNTMTTMTTTPATTESRSVSVTIPYGYSLSQIGDALQSKGVCSKSDFLSTINSYDFSYYPLVSQIPANSNRCYKLEGYLYPDTYEFYKNAKPQDVIGKMLRGAESNIGSKYSYSGLSTYQIITLASIIQKEVKNTADMKIVSMIFHNRIKANMLLNADPTINYIENYVKPNLSSDKDRYNSYYNTYKCIGLPAGPICSPGVNALSAAANPDTNYADDYYFFTDKSGKLICSKTLDEHNQKLKEAGISS